MGIAAQKYIRKPLYVDAVRLNAANFDAIADWCQGEVMQDDRSGTGSSKKYIKVRVHNPKSPRQTKAFSGDWLLYTERGYKIYTNKAFHASFDLVEENQETEDRFERLEALALLTPFYIDPDQGILTEEPADENAKPLDYEELVEIIQTEIRSEDRFERLEALAEQDGQPKYPYQDGDTLVLGPECFVANDLSVLSWKGVNYVPQGGIGNIDVLKPDNGSEETPIAPPPTPKIVPPAKEDFGIDEDETTPQGEPIELVEATPQSIADVVGNNVFSQSGDGPVDLADDVRDEAKPAEEAGGRSGFSVSGTTPTYPEETTIGGSLRSEINVGMPQPADTVENAPESESVQPAAVEGKRVLSMVEQQKMTSDEVRALIQAGEVVLAQDIAQP